MPDRAFLGLSTHNGYEWSPMKGGGGDRFVTIFINFNLFSCEAAKMQEITQRVHPEGECERRAFNIYDTIHNSSHHFCSYNQTYIAHQTCGGDSGEKF